MAHWSTLHFLMCAPRQVRRENALEQRETSASNASNTVSALYRIPGCCKTISRLLALTTSFAFLRNWNVT